MHRTSCKGPTKLANNVLDKEEVDALKAWLKRDRKGFARAYHARAASLIVRAHFSDSILGMLNL